MRTEDTGETLPGQEGHYGLMLLPKSSLKESLSAFSVPDDTPSTPPPTVCCESVSWSLIMEKGRKEL